MKNFLNINIKVKHLAVLLVLLFALKFVAVKKRGHNHKRVDRKEWRRPDVNRGHQFQRGNFRKGNFKRDYLKLDEVEKAAIDSLRGLIKTGSREDRKLIFMEMKDIMKGN